MIGLRCAFPRSVVKKPVPSAEVRLTVPAMKYTRSQTSRRRGISLLAILLWLAAVAVLSLLAIPHFFNRPNVTLWHAVELLARDLRSAQSCAAYYKVPAAFRLDADGWEATGTDGRPLGASSREAGIERALSGIFEGVQIVRIDFGPDNALVFDTAGRAGEAGEVDLSFKGQTYTLRIEEDTGFVTILGPDGVLESDDRHITLDPAE